jgi:hypothetical protein
MRSASEVLYMHSFVCKKNLSTLDMLRTDDKKLDSTSAGRTLHTSFMNSATCGVGLLLATSCCIKPSSTGKDAFTMGAMGARSSCKHAK